MTRIATLIILLCTPACYASMEHADDLDVSQDADADSPRDSDADSPDLPDETPPPPQYSADFIIENASPSGCSSCVIYLDYTQWYGAMYDLEMIYNGSALAWSRPGCSESCEYVTDPMMCCIDCAAPIPAVQQLVPGQSVTIHWDGMQFPMDYGFCDCGCYRQSGVGPGSGQVTICAYTSYTCLGGLNCVMGENGVIPMADPAGEPVCVQASFSLPADDGGEIILGIP